MKMLLNTVLTGSLIFAASANASVIGKIGSNPYISGDVFTGGDQLVLASGAAVVSLDSDSSAIIKENPLSLTLNSGSACVNLGATKVLDVVDATGNVASFSSDKAASVLATVSNGSLQYKEVAACNSFAFTDSSTELKTALGGDKKKSVVVLLGFIAGFAAVAALTDEEGAAPAASPVQ